MPEWGNRTKRRRVELPLANVSCQSSRVSRRGSVVLWLCVSRFSSNTDDALLTMIMNDVNSVKSSLTYHPQNVLKEVKKSNAR